LRASTPRSGARAAHLDHPRAGLIQLNDTPLEELTFEPAPP
jgi:hypothetical protein